MDRESAEGRRSIVLRRAVLAAQLASIALAIAKIIEGWILLSG